MEVKRINNKKDFDFSSDIPVYCYFHDDRLEFLKYDRYVGPITLQRLPNGGIQSVYGGKLIIKVNNGFLEVTEVKFENKEMSSNDFIAMVGDENLVNLVLL